MSRARKLLEKVERLLEIKLFVPHKARPFYSENPRVHTDNEFTEGEKIYFNFMLGLSGYVVPATVQRVTEKGIMLNCHGITYWVPKKGLQKIEDSKLQNLYWLETWVRRDEEQRNILIKMTQYNIRDLDQEAEKPQETSSTTQPVKWKFPRGKVKDYIKGLVTGDNFLLYLFKKDLPELDSPAPVKMKVMRTTDKAILASSAHNPDRNSVVWIPRMGMNSYQDGLKLDDNLAVDSKVMSVYKTAYENEQYGSNEVEVKAGL